MKKATVYNTVADDLIWKDHIKKEHIASNEWQVKWGFLADHSNTETACKDVENSRNIFRLPPINTTANKPFKGSKPFPQTTSGIIGWKSHNEENKLDKYGRYTKPLKTFMADLNWPSESMI